MKRTASILLLLLIITAHNSFAQNATCPPPNIGFEDGTFNHWQCDTGTFDIKGVLHLAPSPPINMRHTLIDKNYPYPIDYYGGFPALCPNGSGHSMVLGNGNEDEGPQAQRISYTFTVPAGTAPYSLIFNYAVVSAGGSDKKAARFMVRTFDITDSAYIDCASYDVVALPGKAQWKAGSDHSYYTDWTTAAINLTGYGGKQIRLEFTTHFGAGDEFDYCIAYIDVNENCASPITGNAYCTGQSSVTLTAPPGFYSYVWLNANDLSKHIGRNSMLTISPVPPDQSKFAVVTQSMGCFDTLYTVVSKIDAGFVFKVKDTVYTCDGTPVDLTSASITAGSSSDLTYTYYNDSTALSFTYHPQKITDGGNYYVKGVSPAGCNNILPVTVIVLDTRAVNVTDPPAVVFPTTVDISITFPHLNNFTYDYFDDAAASFSIADYKHITRSGTYYVRAFNTSTGCSVIAPVHVTVNPPPAPIIKAPNTFTPNNDGINDRFLVTIIGYDLFKSLKIYNRNGQLIFETKNNYTYWDGTVGGKQASVGTYYWIFNGIYEYDNTEVFKGGSITLIR